MTMIIQTTYHRLPFNQGEVTYHKDTHGNYVPMVVEKVYWSEEFSEFIADYITPLGKKFKRCSVKGVLNKREYFKKLMRQGDKK